MDRNGVEIVEGLIGIAAPRSGTPLCGQSTSQSLSLSVEEFDTSTSRNSPFEILGMFKRPVVRSWSVLDSRLELRAEFGAARVSVSAAPIPSFDRTLGLPMYSE